MDRVLVLFLFLHYFFQCANGTKQDNAYMIGTEAQNLSNFLVAHIRPIL